jgi:hypothetical protein
LVNSGERTPGELVEYAPRVVEAIEGINYTVETVLWAHHRTCFGGAPALWLPPLSATAV